MKLYVKMVLFTPPDKTALVVDSDKLAAWLADASVTPAVLQREGYMLCAEVYTDKDLKTPYVPAAPGGEDPADPSGVRTAGEPPPPISPGNA